MSLADVTKAGSGLPNRYIIHGVEGVGKTSLPAFAPDPFYIQSRGETGLETLIDARQLPEIPHFPQCETAGELFNQIDFLTTGEHEFKTLVIDTLNGVERLIHEEVCKRDFGDDWSKNGFYSYQVGYDTSLSEVRKLLGALDRLRELRRMSIVCLAHTKVKPFKNPEGPDFDRYQPDMHEKTWGLCHKWADAVLFINYETFVDVGKQKGSDATKKGKATSTQSRIMHTVRHAAYDAKNRFGLPEEIDMGTSGQEAWTNLRAALTTARTNGKSGDSNG